MRVHLFYLAVSCCLLGIAVAEEEEENAPQVVEEEQNVTEQTSHTLDPNCPKFCPHSFRPLCAMNSDHKRVSFSNECKMNAKNCLAKSDFTFLHKGMCRRHGATADFDTVTSPEP